MQVVRKYLAAFAAACLLAVLAFGGVSAQVARGAGDNTLTVHAVAENSDYADDIAGADVVVDVYKVALAEPNSTYVTYDYTPTGVFKDLTIPADPDASDWQDLANRAAALVGPTAEGTASADETITGLDDGLYLVLAHGKGNTTLTAESDLYEYTFQPVLVAVPGTSTYNTADPAGWDGNVTMSLKPERDWRYGNLKIVKTVTDFPSDGEPATFVFHITGTRPDDKPYENYASVYFDGGTSHETTVTHIPVGTDVTVTEEYSGARYELVSSDDETKTIVADSDIQFSFTNKSNGSHTGGHGIENNFKLDKIDGGWDWTWNKGTPGPQADKQPSDW